MKPNANIAITALAVASLGVSLFAITRSNKPQSARNQPQGVSPSALPAKATAPDSETALRLAALEAKLEQGNTGDEGSTNSVSDRLDAIEQSLAKLQSSFDGISLEAASEDRDALFRGEDGNLKADEYFAAGKFAIAGEGYLAFLEAHPDHPDAYDILKQARNAFSSAGYTDKAIWAQEELMKNLGQRRDGDLLTLAQLEKDAGRFDDAIAHAAEAAELATEPQQALWHKMYWAWYNQLRDGDEAGLDAYRQVQQEIADGGFSDGKLGERVYEKIDELERQKTITSSTKPRLSSRQRKQT